MILKVKDRSEEVSCETLSNALPDEGEFELEGEPIEVEKCWRQALWRVKGKKYVLSYEIEPGRVKGWVIVRKGKPLRPMKPKKEKRKEKKERRRKGRLKERLKAKRRGKPKRKGK